MMMDWPRFFPSGDAALTVELGEGVSREVNARVVGLHRAICEARPNGIVETVPAFRSLLVQFDPLQTSPEEVQEAVTTLLAKPSNAPLNLREWSVPTCYAPELGLDLMDVAAASGLSPAEVVECHASAPYYIYMLGFLPGFAYMGDLPEPLRLPRRSDPRIRVPRGSVAIANGLTAIYPQECPGGWHILGQTAAVLFDAAASPPAIFEPGDLVRFSPVSIAEFQLRMHDPGGGARLVAGQA